MVYPARFLAMDVLHQCALRTRGNATDGLESPRELCSRSRPSIRLSWGPAGRVRIRWNRSCPHPFEATCRPRGCNLRDQAFVLADALIIGDAPSQSVPLPQFQWRESADPLSLLRLRHREFTRPVLHCRVTIEPVSFAPPQNEASRSEAGGGIALAGFLLSGFLLA